MKKRLLAITALLATGISTSQADTLYLGDGATSDISGAFNSGSQNLDTTTANWTTNKNPTAYQTFASGDDIIILGEGNPVLTVAENLTINNYSRESNVDDNAGRTDIAVATGITLTFSGKLEALALPLDVSANQVNITGAGTVAGSMTMTNTARILLLGGINFASGSEINNIVGGDIRFRPDVGDVSQLTINISGTNGAAEYLEFDKDNMVLKALNGNCLLRDKGYAGFNTINSINPGAQIDGTGIGSITPDTSHADAFNDDLAMGSGTHTFDIDANTLEADFLSVDTGKLLLGGTLTINLAAGTLASGQQFTLFEAGSYTNALTSTNLPALSGSLEWDLSNLTVDGSILVTGELVDDYNGTIYLGNGIEGTGGQYTNSPVTWNTNSANWGLGPVATSSAFTNWIDGSIAVVRGSGSNREINLASNLNVVVSELEWDAPSSAMQLVGVSNSTETITITNELRTALVETSRQVTLKQVTLGGQFNMQNVSRLSFEGQSGVASNTVISDLDGSDIQFKGSTTDYTELSINANGATIRNDNEDRVLGSLTGNGVIDMGNGVSLTIDTLTVGGISNSASFTADASSAGDLILGSGTHNFSINPASGNTDLLEIGSGALYYGGDLIVGANNTNEFSLGQTFKLFDAGTYTGAFNSVVLPTNALPAGAVWHNNLATAGSISVGTEGVMYETINFTEFRGTVFPSDRLSVLSGSITNSQGTILTLELTSEGVLGTNPDYKPWLYNSAIAGVSKDSGGNARLDSYGTDGTQDLLDESDDETLRFKLSIDGTSVDSLALKSLRLDTFGTDEIAEFNDGITTNTLQDTGGSDTVSYDDALSGLTELSKNNVTNWYLDVTARAYVSGGATNDTAVSFDDVQFLVGYATDTPFNLWANEYGLEGADAEADADPDGDLANNLAEFALNGNPTNNADKGVYDVSAFEQGGSNVFEYVHAERKDGSLTYSYELTENLQHGPWVTNSGIYEVGSGDYDEDYNIVTNHTAADVNAKFINLLIEEN